MDADSLDERLENLRKAGGWRLRICYSIHKEDGDDASVRSFHADSLEAVVKRVEQEARTEPKRRAQEPAALPSGWVALPPSEPRPDEWLHSAEKMFQGKAIKQSAASAAGLARACREYDSHRASSIDPEITRRPATPVATGLISTETYRRNTN